MDRQYYSQRNNPNKDKVKIDLFQLKKMFYTLYCKLYNEEYFAITIGYTHKGDLIAGSLGYDNAIAQLLYLNLHKENLWPIYTNIDKYSEEDLFDIMEFCYDCISKLYTEDELFANRTNKDGREIYRFELNKQLKDYNEGFELNEAGHIIRLSSHGLKQLVERKLPTEDEGIISRVDEAVFTYQNRKSSRLQRKEAVRHLADILEGLRKKAEPLIKKADESDLFQLINKFGIRHNNPQQKEDYDDAIFLSWMFHYFLATIHAWLLIIKRNNGNEN
ncbi:MAG: hypothetical protein LBQ88_09665 [Treponema sp.]|jgi:hypothetical protein|nr:hypothetical protein [Treponema sp.]